jgi:Flp pilus assembly protein TadG
VPHVSSEPTCNRRLFTFWTVAARLRSDESGNALLEMAICSLVILTTILGIMQCSLAMYADHFVTNAARAATRYAAVRGSGWAGTSCSSTAQPSCVATATDVTTFVRSLASPGITAANITVTAIWPGTTAAGAVCNIAQGSNSSGCIVQVTVAYPFTFMLPAPSALTIHLKSTSAMVISR